MKRRASLMLVEPREIDVENRLRFVLARALLPALPMVDKIDMRIANTLDCRYRQFVRPDLLAFEIPRAIFQGALVRHLRVKHANADGANPDAMALREPFGE